MNFYLIAGEASGDLHGSNLIIQLKKLYPEAEFRCWGGDKMETAGARLVKHYRELAFMGFSEVLLNIRTIFRNLAFCKKDILESRADALILIDYPGFNLRIAKWAKEQNLKVIYYISPQVWAWKANRVKGMKKNIDKMLVILPFEKDYFRNIWNWNVEYVGHPLIQVIRQHTASQSSLLLPEIPENKKIVALLPGSRKQEILKKLPVMLEVSKAFPAYQFVVAKAPGVDEDFYDELLRPFSNVSYVSNLTYHLLGRASAALVTSGTATLETALFNVPEVVCYKGSYLSYQIGKRLVKVKYISLVNLIMDKPVVEELIQDKMNVANLTKSLDGLLHDTLKIAQMKADYSLLRDQLTAGGDASQKAAELIHKFLSEEA